MNWKGWIGALCLACGLGMEGYAQEPLHAVKVGYSNGTLTGRQIDLCYERALIVPGSVQLELGGMRRMYDFGGRSRDLNFHAGIDFRFFVALRREKELSGAYLGPFVSYHRRHFDYVNPNIKSRRWGCYFGGLALGYQHAFGRHLRLDAGIRFGYGYPYRYTYYPDGQNAIVAPVSSLIFGGYQLKIGYAF